MKSFFIIIFLFSYCFCQIRLTCDTNGSFNNQDIASGIALSFDKILYKQENVKTGVGIEYMIPRNSKDNNLTDIQFNSIYILLRYTYEKKWNSYLKIGYNSLNSEQLNSDGLSLGIGAEYKLNDYWYIESGFNTNFTKDDSYSRIIYSVVYHFKDKDE